MNRMFSPPVSSPQAAAEAYVGAKFGSKLPVSTAEAVRAIRTLLIDCAMTDRELTALVAQAAVAQGLAVSFDGKAGELHTFQTPGM